VGNHIDIQSPILLDVLSEKEIDQARNAKTTASGLPSAVQVVGATPKPQNGTSGKVILPQFYPILPNFTQFYW
jgi:hypothetical protein